MSIMAKEIKKVVLAYSGVLILLLLFPGSRRTTITVR